jgi:hypothetical protein
MTAFDPSTVTRHTEPNTELFKKIYKQIKKAPGSFDMANWEDRHVDPSDTFWNHFVKEAQPRSCGTTRCVAGWASHFTAPRQSFLKTINLLSQEWNTTVLGDPSEVGAGLLGLSVRDAEQLFLYTNDERAVRVVKAFAKGKNKKALRILYESED